MQYYITYHSVVTFLKMLLLMDGHNLKRMNGYICSSYLYIRFTDRAGYWYENIIAPDLFEIL